jgi:hypothetical protein
MLNRTTDRMDARLLSGAPVVQTWLQKAAVFL